MALYPNYATLAEFKSYLRLGTAVTDDDTNMSLALTAASREIDRTTGRQFGQAGSATIRYFTADEALEVEVFDLMDSSGLAVAVDYQDTGSFTTVATPILEPINAAADNRPWTEMRWRATDLTETLPPWENAVKVTAKWGWSAVPDEIKNACLLQASRIVKRRDAPFGIAGAPELGGGLRLLSKLDPDVEVLVEPFVKHWGAV